MSLAIQRVGSAGQRRRLAGAPAIYDPLTEDAGLERYWIASLGLTAPGGVVSLWEDQVEGAQMPQGTSGFRPTYEAAGLGGEPSVLFDGVDDRLAGGPGNGFSSLSQRYHMIVYMEMVSDLGGTQIVFDEGPGGVGNVPILFWNGTSWVLGSPTQLNSGDNTFGGASMWVLDANGASSRIFRNDVTTPLVTGSAGTSGPNSLTVGTLGTGTLPSNVRVAEIAFTTSTDLSGYQSRAQDLYGIAA